MRANGKRSRSNGWQWTECQCDVRLQRFFLGHLVVCAVWAKGARLTAEKEILSLSPPSDRATAGAASSALGSSLLVRFRCAWCVEGREEHHPRRAHHSHRKHYQHDIIIIFVLVVSYFTEYESDTLCVLLVRFVGTQQLSNFTQDERCIISQWPGLTCCVPCGSKRAFHGHAERGVVTDLNPVFSDGTFIRKNSGKTTLVALLLLNEDRENQPFRGRTYRSSVVIYRLDVQPPPAPHTTLTSSYVQSAFVRRFLQSVSRTSEHSRTEYTSEVQLVVILATNTV